MPASGGVSPNDDRPGTRLMCQNADEGATVGLRSCGRGTMAAELVKWTESRRMRYRLQSTPLAAFGLHGSRLRRKALANSRQLAFLSDKVTSAHHESAGRRGL